MGRNFLIYFFFFINQQLDQNKPSLIINTVVVYPPAEMFLYCCSVLPQIDFDYISDIFYSCFSSMLLAQSLTWMDLPIYKITKIDTSWIRSTPFFHFCLPLKSHMFKSLLLKEFVPKTYTACTDTPSNKLQSLYLITVAPGHRQSASDSSESSGLQRGEKYH